MPGQDGYDAARRVWNGAFDRKPAPIARCAGTADVTAAVNFARAHELIVAVRGGGHSLSGQSVCDGGLMIDLSPDEGHSRGPARQDGACSSPACCSGSSTVRRRHSGSPPRPARCRTPARPGSLSAAASGASAAGSASRATTSLGADVVTADGRFLKAGAKDNADLLWGLRGGGGNFGIVTSFEYQLHAVPPRTWSVAISVSLSSKRAGICCARLRTSSAGAADGFYCDVAIVPNAERTAKSSRSTCVMAEHLRQAAKVCSRSCAKGGTPVMDGR